MFKRKLKKFLEIQGYCLQFGNLTSLGQRTNGKVQIRIYSFTIHSAYRNYFPQSVYTWYGEKEFKTGMEMVKDFLDNKDMEESKRNRENR